MMVYSMCWGIFKAQGLDCDGEGKRTIPMMFALQRSLRMKNQLMIIFFSLLFCLTGMEALASQPVWEKGQYKIFLQNNILEFVHDQSSIAVIQALEFNFIRPDSILVTRVSPDTLYLKLLFTESDGFHHDFPSQLLMKIAQFNNTFHLSASHKTFHHITIRLKDQNEHYFGLIEKSYPHNTKNPDLRGNVVDVEVYGNGDQDYAENYASAYSAFFMSSAGYGSFFDTFAKGRYQFAINGTTEIYHQTGALDWYLFCGSTGDAIHKEYYAITGKPKYVPMWACGPIFWRDQNNGGKDEILDDIKKFTDLKIPLTACWVDRPYSNGALEWSKMDFNKKFSEPEKWISTINTKYGMEFMTWAGPLTMADTNFPGRLMSDRGYIDLTNPLAIKEFGDRLQKNQYAVGVRGHKMDRADENFPVTALWYTPTAESESRNKYIYLFSKVIDEFLSKAWGKNQFNFARSAFHRSQPFLSAVWGGDSRSNWQGFAGSEANAMRCGFLGFPVWGGDTGGYLGDGRIEEELYIRWLQWGAWNGMFETKIDGSGGSGEDRPPWKYSTQLQSVYREACTLRMNLLPYIYSCVNTSYTHGVVMKPIAYMYPADEKTYDLWDEYFFGNAFLVAPVFTKSNSRTIYLPKGTWYDFNNPAVEYTGPVMFTQHVPLTTTPVFIKGNSIYVTGNVYQGNSRIWENTGSEDNTVVIHAFPGQVQEQVQFDYIDSKNDDKEIAMILEHHAGVVVFSSGSIGSQSTIELKCVLKPTSMFLNKMPVNFKYDEKRKIASVQVGMNTLIDLKMLSNP
jgi:alpha-glucosidase (family GH31 glycosyl hydrolase)